jgi:molecular chaperone DnaK (HSP70)
MAKSPPPYYSGSGQNEFSPFESQADLVIGIDFGTTFTGVAYGFGGKANSAHSITDRSKIADKVVVIKAWPGASNAEKIPTLLSYNTTPPTWGVKVKPADEPRIAHFKLGLQENVGEHYKKRKSSSSESTTSVLGGYINDPNWRHPRLPQKQAVDYTADYLTHVCQYVLKESLPRTYGKQFLQNQQMSYVITVPAIWSDKAKELTRQAAFKAGISRRKLILITEPEAAALYCATLCKEVDLQEGDRFLICDAGGGTVVYPMIHWIT